MASHTNGEYVFKIDAFSPETFPMSRLAEYMADLATLLGEHESVHFVELTRGSTALVHAIEPEAEPRVRDRICSVRAQEGPIEALRAVRSIDKRLARDHASGSLIEPSGKELLEFPGRKSLTQPVYGPFNQDGIVDGIPIRVGGEGNPVPVHLLKPGDQNKPDICFADRQIAKEIAHFLFTSIIRVKGVGRWHRDWDGTWVKDKFTIRSFDVINDDQLSEVVAKLRSIEGGFKNIQHPLRELDTLRHG